MVFINESKILLHPSNPLRIVDQLTGHYQWNDRVIIVGSPTPKIKWAKNLFHVSPVMRIRLFFYIHA